MTRIQIDGPQPFLNCHSWKSAIEKHRNWKYAHLYHGGKPFQTVVVVWADFVGSVVKLFMHPDLEVASFFANF